jgi:stage II sporulation protein D
VARRGLIGVLALLAAAVAASDCRAATVVVVTGRGWGHGVGMSQWGAYGYARHGWSWQRILAHYYPGTRLGATPDVTVRVLLAASQPRVQVGCAGGIRVSDAAGRSYALRGGSYGVGPALRLPVGGHRRARSLASPLVFDCPSAPLLWNGSAYHGLLVVRSGGGKLAVVDSVDLEDYVRGVVGAEMPRRFGLEALEAQAVAARSYALATLHPGARFDLFADDRSQVYGGIGAESAPTNFAVDRTAGRILTWDGRVATTTFFSSSGGRTADAREVWPALGDVPYLRSVADPYDGTSPNHVWGPFAFSAQTLAARLHVPFGPVRVLRTASGRVAAVRLGSQSVTGVRFRSVFRLRSAWFSLGELSLSDTRESVVYGGKVGLVARAVGVGVARLQRRVGSGPWVTLRRVRGSERAAVEPQGYTLYRVTAGRVRGPEVAVSVAPKLRVRAAASALLTGRVEPRSRGQIAVSRQVGGTWRIVARPLLDGHGVFRAPLRLHPGGYRVTIAADDRLAPATATVRVTARLLAAFRGP